MAFSRDIPGLFLSGLDLGWGAHFTHRVLSGNGLDKGAASGYIALEFKGEVQRAGAHI